MREWIGLLGLVACLGSTGCVSLGGEGPTGGPPERLPAASRARCAEYALTHSTTFNGDADDPDPSELAAHDEEREALTELVNHMVIETGLVGFVGQEGLDGTRLTIDVRRDVSASILHGVGTALTLFLVPFWIQVTYEVRADLYGVDHGHVTSSARGSWYVLVSPFLVFAMPFDEAAQPVGIVEVLTKSVLTDLVAQEEHRQAADD